jgi:hypothetical protein
MWCLSSLTIRFMMISKVLSSMAASLIVLSPFGFYVVVIAIASEVQSDSQVLSKARA